MMALGYEFSKVRVLQGTTSTDTVLNIHSFRGKHLNYLIKKQIGDRTNMKKKKFKVNFEKKLIWNVFGYWRIWRSLENKRVLLFLLSV